MLRMRYAIERASAHPWLWLVVVLILAVLLVFLLLHVAEHGLLDAATVACVLMVVLAAVFLPAPLGRDLLRESRLRGRAPPRPRAPAAVSSPCFVPLRA